MNTVVFNDAPNPWDNKIRATLTIGYKHPKKQEIEKTIESNLKEGYRKEVLRDGGSIKIRFLSDEVVAKFKALNLIEPPQT